jgi:hypothetical protein
MNDQLKSGAPAVDWEPHTCTHPPEVDLCAGCKQREELKLNPLSQAARDRIIERDRIARGPSYAIVGVGAPDRRPGMYFGSCSWCGSLVIAAGNAIDDQRPAHSEWHRKIIDACGPAGLSALLVHP